MGSDVTIPVGDHITHVNGSPEWVGIVFAVVGLVILAATALLLAYRGRRSRRNQDRKLIG